MRVNLPFFGEEQDGACRHPFQPFDGVLVAQPHGGFARLTALFDLVVVQAVAGDVGTYPDQHRRHGGKRQDDGTAEVAVRELCRVQTGRQQLGIGWCGITRDLRHLALAEAGDEVIRGGVHHR